MTFDRARLRTADVVVIVEYIKRRQAAGELVLIASARATQQVGAAFDALIPRLGDEALRVSMLLGLSFYVIAAAMMWAGSRRLAHDWHQ